MKAIWAVFRELLTVLPANSRRFLIGYSISLGSLAILDAVSLGLLALVLTPLITGTAVTMPLLGVIEGNGLIVMLVVVCLLVILKGVLSVLLYWIATRRFMKYELAIGNRLLDSYLASNWVDRLKRNSSDLIRIADVGLANTIAKFLLPTASLLGEALTFITVVVVLAVVQPTTALIAVVYLGLVGLLLYFWISRRSQQAGRVNLRYSFRVARLLTEMVGALKEVTLRDKTDEVAEVVLSNRVHTARARANIQFLANVPRFVLEAAIIGGFVLVGATGFLIGGVTQAFSAVALFSLAGFRMAPSITRFQAVVSSASSNVPHAEAVIKDIRFSERTRQEGPGGGHLRRDTGTLADEPRSMALADVAFRYEPDRELVLEDVTIDIPFGSTVAFVGASGSGKSTLVDLILGLIEPTSGTVQIDGTPLTDVTRAWRSRVGYVPQEVSLFDGTVAQNVALTWTDDFDPDRVRSALEQAQLLHAIEARPGGIDAPIGERGLALSGGQRQRLGIARALYAEPLVLVMDEATSALDTTTEAAVSDAIKTLHGSVTVVIVAHRLSTIMHADQIFFLSAGRVAAQGTFHELIAHVPEFAQQAGLAGLAR